MLQLPDRNGWRQDWAEPRWEKNGSICMDFATVSFVKCCPWGYLLTDFANEGSIFQLLNRLDKGWNQVKLKCEKAGSTYIKKIFSNSLQGVSHHRIRGNQYCQNVKLRAINLECLITSRQSQHQRIPEQRPLMQHESKKNQMDLSGQCSGHL